LDCVLDQAFDNTTLELKENNTRIRLLSTNAPDTLGKSWSIAANDNSNGGPSYLAFEAKSLTDDGLKLSDGFNRALDCDEGDTVDPFTLALTNNLVPFGEPVLTTLVDKCALYPWPTVDTALKLSTPALDLVALGNGSMPVLGQVSVGTPSGLRRISHVAEPTDTTDVLTVGELTAYSLLRERSRQLPLLRQQVETLRSQVVALEQADADGDGISNVQDPQPLGAAVTATQPIPVNSPWFLLALAGAIASLVARRYKAVG
jgi:hypothetical protein